MVSKGTLLNIAFIYYTVIAVTLFLLLQFIGKRFKEGGKNGIYKISMILSFIIVIPIPVYVLAWVDAIFIEPNWIQVTKLTVKSENFGPELKNVRILQISDLHIENIGYREKKLIQMINDLKPDVVLYTGDFISSAKGLPLCLEALRPIKAKKGIYAILGNHDYYYLPEKTVIDAVESIGIRILRHENVKLDFGERGYFWLVGLSDKYGVNARYGDVSSISTSFQGVPLDEPKIMLIHNPDVADLKIISQYKPQLILAGHTHGGQFGIPFIRKRSWYAERSTYMEGLFKVNNIPLYVNRGIGMITRKIRFFSRPEITIIKLVKGKNVK